MRSVLAALSACSYSSAASSSNSSRTFTCRTRWPGGCRPALPPSTTLLLLSACW